MHACTHPGWPVEKIWYVCVSFTLWCHLQVLNLFGFKFLHVIFEACGGPQTFNFSFLEGGFKLFRESRHQLIHYTHIDGYL